MKIYTITTNFISETDNAVHTFVATNKADAIERAKEERRSFRNLYFDEDDDDYYEYERGSNMICANSNCCYCEFTAFIEEHEV